MAKNLRAMHTNSPPLFHGGLNPGKVYYLRSDYSVRFGMVELKTLGPSNSDPLRRDPYLPPEMFQPELADFSAPADIFSLGSSSHFYSLLSPPS